MTSMERLMLAFSFGASLGLFLGQLIEFGYNTYQMLKKK